MGIFDFFKKKKQETTTQVQPSKQLSEEEIKAILDNEIQTFFPDSGWWGSSCFKRPNDIYKPYFPCHTRDYEWMSRLLELQLADKGIKISSKTILPYIKESTTFNELRHNYELKIVHWQITFMKDGGSGWLIPKGFDHFSLLVSEDVDKMFRGGVVKTLEAIGLPRDVIEEGIEKNADLWRLSYMNQGYTNAYEPYRVVKGKPPITDKTHRKNWIKLRLYQYYCENKTSVDKYGVLTPAMQMTTEEFETLREVVKKQNAQRKTFITEWEKLPATEVSKDENSQDMGYII